MSEKHKQIVRYLYTGEPPGRPALPILYRRSSPPRQLDDDPEINVITHYYDPLVSVSPPSPPAPVNGTILAREDLYLVSVKYTDTPPTTPDLEIRLLDSITHTLESGRKQKTWFFDPDLEPAPDGAQFTFLNGADFTFLDGDDFEFLANAPLTFLDNETLTFADGDEFEFLGS